MAALTNKQTYGNLNHAIPTKSRKNIKKQPLTTLPPHLCLSHKYHDFRPLMLLWPPQNHPIDQIMPSDGGADVGAKFGAVLWRYCCHPGPYDAQRPNWSWNPTFSTKRSAIWSMKSPKQRLTCMQLTRMNRGTMLGLSMRRFALHFVFSVLIQYALKKLDAFDHILTI